MDTRGLDDHFLGRPLPEQDTNQVESGFVRIETREPPPGTYSYVKLPVEDFGRKEPFPLTPVVTSQALVSLGLPATMCRLAHLDANYKLDKPETKFPIVTRERSQVLRRIEVRLDTRTLDNWYRLVKEEMFDMNICPDTILNVTNRSECWTQNWQGKTAGNKKQGPGNWYTCGMRKKWSSHFGFALRHDTDLETDCMDEGGWIPLWLVLLRCPPGLKNPSSRTLTEAIWLND